MDQGFIKITNLLKTNQINNNIKIKKNNNKEHKLVDIKYNKYHFEMLENDIKSKIEKEWSTLFKKKINDLFESTEISRDDKEKMIKSISSSLSKLKKECGDRIIDIKKYLDVKDILQTNQNIYIPGLDISRSNSKKPLTFKLPDVIGFSIDPKTREKNMLFISKLARDIMNLGSSKFSNQLPNFISDLRDNNISEQINTTKDNYPIIKYWEIYSKLISQISTGNIDINFLKGSRSLPVIKGGTKSKQKKGKKQNKDKNKQKEQKKKPELDQKTKDLIKELDRIRKFEECKSIEEKNNNNKKNKKCEEQINSSIRNFNSKGYDIFIKDANLDNTLIKIITENPEYIISNQITKIKDEIYETKKEIIINYDIENEFIKKMKSSLIKNYFTNSWVNLPYQNRNIEKLNEFASITDETIKEGIKKVYLIFDVIKYYREFYKELKGDVRYKFFVNSIKQPSINDKYDLELNISRGLYVYLNVMYNELKLLLEYVNSKFQSIVSTKSKEDKKEKNQPKKEKKEKKEKKKKKG